MKIQKIKIEGFKSIYDPMELDFREVNGFWKLSGSVGAGKTSIGEAIIYGLFGSVNGKASSTEIQVAPQNNGKEYIVVKGLEVGDVIVAEGAGLIKEGTVIKSKSMEGQE